MPTFTIGIIFIILLTFYNYDSYIYTSKINLFNGNVSIALQFSIDIYRWIIGFVGSVIVIYLCRFLCSRFDGKVMIMVAYFGRITFGVYILNTYANQYILLKLTYNFKPNVLIWIAEIAVSMVIYVVIIDIIKRIPFANKLLFGKR